MLKFHVYNLPERKNNFFNEFQQIEPLMNKNYYLIDVISSYEVFVYYHFVNDISFEEQEIEIEENFNLSRKQILNITKNSDFIRNKQLCLLDENQNLNCVISKNKFELLYGFFIGDEIEKNFLNFFQFDAPIFIKTNDDEKPNFFSENRNIITYNEFKFHIQSLNIPYGLAMTFLKKNMLLINKYLNVNNRKTLTNKHINIHNSIREMVSNKSKKRWRSNKKIHILNINNVDIIDNYDIYLFNDKFYFIFNNIVYNIKMFLELKRSNIIKIKDKYNRSNENIFIYKKNFERFIMKTTKSISKNLTKNLEEKGEIIKFNDFYNKFGQTLN